MFFQIESGKVIGYAPTRDNLTGDVIKADLPKGYDPEVHLLDALRWDGKEVILDPDYAPPPEPVPVEMRVEQLENQVKILAKKVSGETLTPEEEAILANL